MRAFTSKTLQWRGLRSGESGERCDLCMLDCVIHPMSTMRTQSPFTFASGLSFLAAIRWGLCSGAVWVASPSGLQPCTSRPPRCLFSKLCFRCISSSSCSGAVGYNWKSADRYAGPVVWQRVLGTVVVVTALKVVASLALQRRLQALADVLAVASDR